MILPVLLLAFLFLAGLLAAERRESQAGILLTKPVVSALFIVAIFHRPHPEAAYFWLILVGLIFCWLGDLFLVFFFRKKFFLAGLAAFLTGHVMYAVAFFLLGGASITVWLALLPIGVASGYVFVRLRPFLGEMRLPVIGYVIIISLMLLGARALAGNPAMPALNRGMTLLGAFSFYLSDIFVARQRFLRPQYANRLFGLVLYYVGQFLIALAAGGLVK
ncbi:MAG: lysoplasmalogenase [Chloroflexota bacterium]